MTARALSARNGCTWLVSLTSRAVTGAGREATSTGTVTRLEVERSAHPAGCGRRPARYRLATGLGHGRATARTPPWLDAAEALVRPTDQDAEQGRNLSQAGVTGWIGLKPFQLTHRPGPG